MNGILNINKAPGMTSYQVVAAVKRLSGERKAGHAGTLDPTARGVLPVCLGKATRTMEYFLDTSKTYLAEIELGVTTDSYDSSGQVTGRRDTRGISQSQVTTALSTFLGLIQQTPPMFSALKHHGTPLYRLARAGVTVERPPRPAQIYRIELKSFEPPIATIEVECGRGTYIRSLAHDLGEALGCGGTLRSLVRLQYGPFGISDAVTIPMLEDAFRSGHAEDYLYPVEFVLSHLPAVTANHELVSLLKHGHHLDVMALSQPPAGEPKLRVYTPSGQFLGIWRLDPASNRYRAEKVLSPD
ncbi:MAG: tRNA pseudouridine(55) synthase TruB [Chloroflexota bacterium]